MPKGQQGFLGSAALASEQGGIIACGIWENGAAADRAMPKIGEWVGSNLKGFDAPTESMQGHVGPHVLLAPQSGSQGQSLYCIVRKAENLSSVAVHRPVVEEMLAAMQTAPGFRGAYWFRFSDDQTRGGSVLFFDDGEHAHAAHEASLVIMNKHQPNVTVRVAGSGTTAILAMA